MLSCLILSLLTGSSPVLLPTAAAAAASAEPAAPRERAQSAQDKPPVPPPVPPAIPPEVPGAASGAASEPPLLGSDGRPLQPGVLPADVDPAARELWQRVLAASVVPGGEPKPLTSFSLDIDLQFKAAAESVNSSAVRYEYLAPGDIRFRFEKPVNAEHLRGPDGDFLIDPDRDGAKKLERAVRENADDLKQIDDTLVIARNFVALTDPKTLRIARLARLDAPPAVVPKQYAARAKALTWLVVESPDFRVTRAAAGTKGARLFRVELGVDPKTALPELVAIHDGATKAAVGAGSMFLQLANWFDADGYKVPRQIQTFEIDTESVAAGRTNPLAYRYMQEPTSDAWLKNARLNPPLTRDSFRPARKK